MIPDELQCKLTKYRNAFITVDYFYNRQDLYDVSTLSIAGKPIISVFWNEKGLRFRITNGNTYDLEEVVKYNELEYKSLDYLNMLNALCKLEKIETNLVMDELKKYKFWQKENMRRVYPRGIQYHPVRGLYLFGSYFKDSLATDFFLYIENEIVIDK